MPPIIGLNQSVSSLYRSYAVVFQSTLSSHQKTINRALGFTRTSLQTAPCITQTHTKFSQHISPPHPQRPWALQVPRTFTLPKYMVPPVLHLYLSDIHLANIQQQHPIDRSRKSSQNLRESDESTNKQKWMFSAFADPNSSSSYPKTHARMRAFASNHCSVMRMIPSKILRSQFI